MNDYSQPDFYRFNQDSTQLIRWILNKKINPRKILDLGAGCGILGIELAKQSHPESVTFVEVQTENYQHLIINCQHFLPSTVQSAISISSFLEFQTNECFDLIVCNPPYFLPGESEQSSNPQRAISRSFLIDSWVILIAKIDTLLSEDGKCYLVVKADKKLQDKIGLLSRKHNLATIFTTDQNLSFIELFRLNEN